MEPQGIFLGSWGGSYEAEIKAINKYFSQRLVFVYGTLMSGETNHRYLENSICLGKAFIEGYDMYGVGWYPAIVLGDNIVIGELYQVPLKDMPAIDRLEGEGRLYVKKCETVSDGEGRTAIAFVYVYIGDVSNLKGISSWIRNMYCMCPTEVTRCTKDSCAILMGVPMKEADTPCSDTTPPVAVKTVEIPHVM